MDDKNKNQQKTEYSCCGTLDRLFNVPKPYPDEFLFSWAYRVVRENCFSLKSFYDIFLEKQYDGHIYFDASAFFNMLASKNLIGDNITDLYLSLSTFSFESIAMTPGSQERYINSMFRQRDKLSTKLPSYLKTIKICPECVEEDKSLYKRAYFHRCHQLTGVCTCAKHKTKLLCYKGKNVHLFDFNLSDYEPVDTAAPMDCLFAYADYAKGLLDSKISTDLSVVKKTVKVRLDELGYNASDSYRKFSSDFANWDYAGLYSHLDNPAYLIVKIISQKAVFMEELLPALMFLFPYIGEFSSALGEHEPLLEQYSCGVCKHIYYSNPQSQRNGWGCPYCESSVPETERFRDIIGVVGNNEYDLLSDFISMNKSVKLLHKPCGKEMSALPVSFLFREKRCSCKGHVSYEEAKKKVESYPGFTFVDYSEKSTNVIILHASCGTRFSCTLKHFLSFPICRNCGPFPTHGMQYSKDNSETGTIECSGTDSQAENPNEDHAFSSDKEWMDYYDLLKEYKAEFETICVPYMASYKGRPLYQWYTKQRRAWMDGRLPRWQAELLGDIGATSSFSGEKWENMYSLYQEYTLQTGSPDISERENFNGKKLGSWVSEQRRLFLNGRLPADRARRLLAVNPDIFSPNEPTWEGWFQLYKQYITKTGSAKIKQKTVFEGKHLGQWIAEQIKAYRKGKLSDERKEKLLSVNADIFSSNDTKWDLYLDSYVRYVFQTGSAYVSKNAMFEDKNLGKWLSKQKELFHKGKLKKDREEKLLSINPDIFKNYQSYNLIGWEGYYEMYKRYIACTGSTHVKKRTDFEGNHLGRWLSDQKKLYRKGKLRKDREEKLRAVNPHLFDE